MSQGTVSPRLRQIATAGSSRLRRQPTPGASPIEIAHLPEQAQAATGLAALYATAVTALTLGAFALRLVMLDRFPFREDEAAYAYWALHGWLEDPLFLQVWPDKPPVFLWLLGGAFRLFGVSEASARWVNVASSTLLIPVVAAIARRLWGRSASLAAAAVLALNPYAISFGPTAYTDPVLVLAGMLAFCAAIYGRALGAGLMLGAAVMTKQQGVFYALLVAGWLLLDRNMIATEAGRLVRKAAAVAAGAALVILPVLYWDSRRWTVAPSPWDLSVRNYAAIRLLAWREWPDQTAEWGPLLWNLAASWAVWAGLAVVMLGGVLAMRRRAVPPVDDIFGSRDTWGILLIGGWSLAFLAAHMLTTVQAWDRYLLPLAPMLALGTGWAVSHLSRSLSGVQMAGLAVAGLLLLIVPAHQAANGRIPVGGDHGDYAGLPAAIEATQRLSRDSFILYHRALGSHYRFYLYGHTQSGSPDSDVELRWFPSAVYLADNAAKMPYPRKFVIEPDWAPLTNLGPHLAMRGLALSRHGRYGRFVVWEIVRDPVPPCDWCASRAYPHWPVIADARKDATMASR